MELLEWGRNVQVNMCFFLIANIQCKICNEAKVFFSSFQTDYTEMQIVHVYIFLWLLYCRKYLFDDSLTPYMHVLIHHAAEFAENYGSLTPFEMEDIEYLNYENKLLFFGASTKCRP